MSDNPFNDNPFAIASSNANGRTSTGAWGSGTTGAWGTSTAPIQQSTSFTAPISSPTASVPAVLDTNRESDLSRREADLNRREAELRRLEMELRTTPGAKSTKNFPPFCSCIHHDIAGQVPAAMQGTVRCGYFAYLGLVICLFWNFIGTIGALIVDGDLATFLWGALYVLGGVPGGWYFWYGRLYNASIKDSAFGYGLFFLFFTTMHMVFTGWSVIAPPILNSWTHTGFWITIQSVFGRNTGLGVIYFIGSGLWAVEFLLSFWTLKKVYSAFRGKGLTAADVKRDAARGAVSAAV